MSIAIERVAEASPELHDLIGELNDILGAAYEAHQRHGLSIDQLFEPHVRLFLARLDGVVVGCGGVAVFDDYAEVKRMYTRPAARGRGVAKALLYIIQDEARRANKSVLRLETGTYQREAIGLYERMGFRPRGPFGPYAAMQARNIETSLFFEKDPSIDRRRCFRQARRLETSCSLTTFRAPRDSNECTRASRPR